VETVINERTSRHRLISEGMEKNIPCTKES
jgi:hypothetical protein